MCIRDRPLEAGIVAAFEGISQEEAEAKIKHSTTYGSFEDVYKRQPS